MVVVVDDDEQVFFKAGVIVASWVVRYWQIAVIVSTGGTPFGLGFTVVVVTAIPDTVASVGGAPLESSCGLVVGVVTTGGPGVGVPGTPGSAQPVRASAPTMTTPAMTRRMGPV